MVLRHALRNALLPTVTVIGLTFGDLLSGAVLTETIFSWPGHRPVRHELGDQRRYPGGARRDARRPRSSIHSFNLVVDVVYAYLDPQIRYT